jgi:hypothetical protein
MASKHEARPPSFVENGNAVSIRIRVGFVRELIDIIKPNSKTT